MVNWPADQTKCLGTEEPPGFLSPNSQLNEPSAPPGFDRQIVEEINETLAPPDFEVIQPIKSSPSQKTKAQKCKHEGLGKRLTRSQAKKVKEKVSTERNSKKLSSVSSFNGSREFSPQSITSSKTTESMAKLALESLEIGKLFGVKVSDKKEAVLKRITSGLKKERKVSAT